MKLGYEDTTLDFFHQLKTIRAKENVIPQKQVEKIIHNVFWDLAKMIKCTIGPCGGNTLITEPYANTPIFPTKDGLRVVNNHVYNHIAYESIYRVIHDISSRMNQVLGDCTSSSLVVGADFYDRVMKFKKKHREVTPFGIKKLLDMILEKIKIHLNEDYVHPIKDLPHEKRVEIYRKIATISANNDSQIGDMVAEAYAQSQSIEAYIDIKESSNADDHIETNLGFEISNGYVLAHMANSADGITARYNDPLFLLVDGPLLDPDLENLQKFVHWVCEEMSPVHPLVIIASEYSKKVMDYFTEICTGVPRIVGGRQVLIRLPVVAICMNMANEYGISRLQDLEACLGAHALKTSNGTLQAPPTTPTALLLLLGRADEVESKYAYTRIQGGGGNYEVRKGRIEEIQKLLKQIEDENRTGIQGSMRIENLKRRIGMLEGQMHCIYVGGDSFKEKKERSLIFEDAVMATKACIENGVMLGGQVSIYDLIMHGRADEIADEVLKDLNAEKTFNVSVGLGPVKLKEIIKELLEVIAVASQAAFKAVFHNASNSRSFSKKIFDRIEQSGETFNLISGKFEGFKSTNVGEDGKFSISWEQKDIPDLIVPGNTDYELLRSVFAIVGLFITSNQLLSVHVRNTEKK